MRNNFTSRVQKVIRYSKEEAMRLGHDYIGTEHLLLGILKEGEGIGIKILQNLNCDLVKLKKAIEDATTPSGGTMTIGNLPLSNDPKMAWAKQHLHCPVEVNRASRAELLRVPGIGPKSAEAIITARRQEQISDLQQLKQIGVWTARAAPYILLNGRQPGYQLRLFSN